MKYVVLLLAIFLLLPKVVFAHGDGVISIHVMDSGFESSELTINKGETVIFENIGTVDHWPASDIHPTHGIYPEFDLGRGLAPGESWEFTFDKVGRWNMHDHNFPSFVGKIIVEGNESEVVTTKPQSNIFQRIWSSYKVFVLKVYYSIFPDKLEKISITNMADQEDKISLYLKILGSDSVMEKLLVEAGGGSVYDCHREAHYIGKYAYKLFGAGVFSQGDASCHSGFYHGAMETFLNEEGTDNIAQKIDTLCNQFETSFGIFECVHGVGHGVMAYEQYDLPKALDVCGELSSSYDASSCYGGVFMENIVASQGAAGVAGHTTKWVSSDPHFPCSGLPDDPLVQDQCYLMQTSRMLDVYKFDFEEVSAECLNTPQDYRDSCFISLGRDIAGITLRDNKSIVEKCSFVDSRFRYFCYTGAVNVIIDFWGEKLGTQADDFCNLLFGIDQVNCKGIVAARKIDVFDSI